MGMCRFTGLEDVEYRKVAAALCRITNAISRKPRKGEFQFLGEKQRQVLLDSLRFDQIDARQMTIKTGHAKTCKWLLKMPEYLDWLDINKLIEHHGFLWIKGKPGTGKSTLMKFAHAYARKKMKDRIIISFFFNARGEDLEKSTAGMYRSLLLQLLERVPELQCAFDSLGLIALRSSGSHQWSVETLKELFEHAIHRLGQQSVTCFIDALDECEERQIRDMVSFFEQLGESALSARIRFQVCFSSRHYPHITISKGLDLILEGQEGHDQDIANYLDSELKIGQGKLAEEIRGDLQKKASGVFMWVVLVVEILNKEHDGGRIHVLRRKLRDIPNDLHELFRQILMRDCNNRDELLLCIQWVLFSKQPLKPEQLYFAILSGVEPEVLRSGNADEITMDVMKKFILNSSKGLAEVTKSGNPTVQFIHESVRDFLVKENGLSELFPDLGDNFRGQSHERLKHCCLTYMGMDVSTHLDLSKPLPKASTEQATDLRQLAAKMFPFLEYAVHLVLYHADEAQDGGVDQGGFIQKFPLANWIKLNNLFEKHEVRRHKPKASLLYIFAETNMPNLIKIHPNKLSYLEVEEERYGLPLFAALATGNKEAVQTFIALEMDKHTEVDKLRELYNQYQSKPAVSRRDFKFSKQRAIVWYISEFGDEMIWTFLFNARKVPVTDIKDKNGRTPFSWAAERGYEAVIKLLLEMGEVDTDSRDNDGQTPLSRAAMNGHEAVIKLLLETGEVDADSRDNNGQTPLSWAAMNGREAVIKLLLETGKVDTDSRDYDGRTSLSRAVMHGREAVIKLLLETGKVNADSRDNYGRTPFWWAVMNGHEVVIKLLLETGKVDTDSRDDDGRTPLWHATNFWSTGSNRIISMLLATGNVDPSATDKHGISPLARIQASNCDDRDEILEETLLYIEKHKK
jgi:ankyrin repeat protein